eukprot:TRINITY_DN6487_c0_g3_i1.p1 TRINITY_DN6487_c0_g3~~TRINITY_DN6487_c0_g3_i1.p1  ORF type:complete len:351 (+),score=45.37 TRINITY_DN6487_c0_g3_i1:48-1055(+)
MASLCGFFGLVIFLYFYYAEAVRRQVVDEALSSNESAELRQLSSDLLELRDARTNTKLVRSHDASLFFKNGGVKKQEEFTGARLCHVKVVNDFVEVENLSAPCCKGNQAWVCSKFKTYRENWTHPSCDKLNSRALDETACSNEADKAILENSGPLESAMTEEFTKLFPKCVVEVEDDTCTMGHMTERCCEDSHAYYCSAFEGYNINISWKNRSCDKLSRAPDGFACPSPRDRSCHVDIYAKWKKLEVPTTGCRIKVADTTCNLGALSRPCCQDNLALVCSEFKDYNVSWKHPFCFFLKEKHNGTVCSNEADTGALAKDTCLKDAISREKAKFAAE